MLQERSKRKPDLETPDDSLPPSLKRRVRARSYANSNLAVSLSFHHSSSDVKYNFMTGRLSTSNASKAFETQTRLGDTG
jgi:hypothetical protein